MKFNQLITGIFLIATAVVTHAQNRDPVAFDDPGFGVEGFESASFENLPWRESGTGGAGWIIDGGSPISGKFSAQTIADFGESAILQLQVVTGAGMISFSRSNLGSGKGGDVLRFLIDGVVQEEVSDNTAPANVSFPVTAGVHTFTWEYQSFINRGASPAPAQLDEVSFPLPDYSTDEATPFTTPTVLGNDYDPDDNAISVSSADTAATQGLVSDNGDGTFNYDPNGAFDGLNDGEQANDTFDYTIEDGQGGTDTATVTITINGISDPVNQPPVAFDDPGLGTDGFESFSFTELPWRRRATGDGAWDISDGAPIAGMASAQTVAEVGDSATLELQVTTGGGMISFSRANLGPGTDGDLLRFLIDGVVQEEVSDGTDAAAVSFPVTAGVHTFTWEYESFINRGANLGPAQLDEVSFPLPAYSTDEATAFDTPMALGNDYDPEDDPITVISIDTTATQGMVSDNGDGTFNYDPNGAFDALNDGEQATDTFDYTIEDSQGGTDTATVTITINGISDPINQPPVAFDDPGPGGDDFETGDFSAQPWRVSGSAGWVVSSANPDSGSFAAQTDAGLTESTTLSLQVTTGAGQISFARANLGPGGDGDELTFLLDGVALETVVDNTPYATVSFPVSAGVHTLSWEYVSIVNRGAGALGPALLDDLSFPPPLYETDEATAFNTPNALGNDYDPEDDPIAVVSIDTAVTQGLVSDNGDGTFNYDPNGAFDALNDGEQASDTFDYTIEDSQGGTDTATVTITINGISDPVEPPPMTTPVPGIGVFSMLLLAGLLLLCGLTVQRPGRSA